MAGKFLRSGVLTYGNHSRGDLVTVAEAAEYLCLSPTTVRKLEREGALVSKRTSRRIKFDSVQDLLNGFNGTPS
jgi:excisionase family DNA binding protein